MNHEIPYVVPLPSPPVPKRLTSVVPDHSCPSPPPSTRDRPSLSSPRTSLHLIAQYPTPLHLECQSVHSSAQSLVFCDSRPGPFPVRSYTLGSFVFGVSRSAVGGRESKGPPTPPCFQNPKLCRVSETLDGDQREGPPLVRKGTRFLLPCRTRPFTPSPCVST